MKLSNLWLTTVFLLLFGALPLFAQNSAGFELQRKAFQARTKGNYKDAIQLFEQSARRATTPLRRKYLLTEVALTWKIQAFRYRSQGAFQKALGLLHKAEAYLRQRAKNPSMAYYFRYEIGLTWEVMGQIEKAKKAYFWAERYRDVVSVLLREKKFKEALNFSRSIIRCHKERKNYFKKDAAEVFKQGGSIKCPKDGTLTGMAALDMIGMLHQRMGQMNDAESAYKTGLRMSHTTADVKKYQALLGALYQDKGKYDDAFGSFKAAGKNLDVAKILTRMKKDPAAALWYRSVVKRESSRIKMGLKQLEMMKKYKTPAQGVSPQAGLFSMLSESMTKLGDAYVGLKDFAKAIKVYQEAKTYAVSFLRAGTDNGRNKFMLKRFQFLGYKSRLKKLDQKIFKAQNQ